MSTTPLRVLFVDDEEEIRRGAGLWLSAAGFETAFATNATQGIDHVRQHHPDAVVMDVRMPGMDGITALAELRKHNDTSRIPIVMLSASLTDKHQALESGARFFLNKPYHGAKLIEAVRAAIGEQTAS